jgi:hypothetical protein
MLIALLFALRIPPVAVPVTSTLYVPAGAGVVVGSGVDVVLRCLFTEVSSMKSGPSPLSILKCVCFLIGGTVYHSYAGTSGYASQAGRKTLSKRAGPLSRRDSRLTSVENGGYISTQRIVSRQELSQNWHRKS